MKPSSHTLPNVTNNIRGVTLIEMLVALVITALIVSSVYVAFNAGTKSWQVGDTMMQRYQNARGALDMMSREISQAFINKSGTLYCLGIDGENSWVDRIKSDAVVGSDQFFFVAPIAATKTATDLYRVGYWLRRDPLPPNEITLQRVYEGPNELFDGIDNDGDNPPTDEFDEAYQFYSGTKSDPLSSDNIVMDLDFTFCYGSGWTDDDPTASKKDGDWDSTEDYYPPTPVDGKRDGLPKAVRITIVVQDDKGLTERTFSTVVYLSNAE